MFLDSLIRIRNAQKQNLIEVEILYTKKILRILKIFYYEGFIRGFKINRNKKKIIVFLKYLNSKPIIKSLLIVSKKKNPVFLTHLEILNMLRITTSSYIFSTIDGFIGSSEYLSKNMKQGGLFLCKIN